MLIALILPIGVLAATLKEPDVAILPEKEARRLADQCSRPAPPPFSVTWTPSQEDVASLRRRLPELVGVKSTRCCIAGGRVRSLSGMRLQIVGIVVSGPRNAIYVNALPPGESEQWRTHAEVICDGGDRFWGVVFDPKAGTFSELAFNGVG